MSHRRSSILSLRTLRLCVKSVLVLLALWALLAAMSGCAGVDPIQPASDTPGAERTKRQRELIDDFSQRRDHAQYQAALQNWDAGDPAGCRGLVNKLLERNPGHKEGRQLLADLYLDDGAPHRAKEVLDQLVAEFPNDAQIHHSLGLLSETMGDHDSAVQHLSRAVELEPENELYRLCHQSALNSQVGEIAR